MSKLLASLRHTTKIKNNIKCARLLEVGQFPDNLGEQFGKGGWERRRGRRDGKRMRRDRGEGERRRGRVGGRRGRRSGSRGREEREEQEEEGKGVGGRRGRWE